MNILKIVDSQINKFNLVNSVIESVMKKVIPEATAAACGAYYCYSQPGAFCHEYCWECEIQRVWDEKKYYKNSPSGTCFHACTASCDYYLTGGGCQPC